MKAHSKTTRVNTSAPLIPDQIEKLMEEGFELLELYDYKKALKVGRKLKRLHHSSTFEIMAMAYAGQEKLGKAIKTLEFGVKKAPTVWVLWQLLGNYRSDSGKYGAAYDAYRKALSCPDVWASSVHINRAITFTREDRFAEALEALDKVEDDSLALDADYRRLFVLNKLARHEEALALGQKRLEKFTGDEEEEDLSYFEAELGNAYWMARKDRDRALEMAWKALSHDRGHADALWLIREIEHRVSPDGKYYRMLLEGKWPEPDENGNPLGFITNYDVVAETPAEALEYARRFEPKGVAETLTICECREIEPRPEDPAGVYNCTGHALYGTGVPTGNQGTGIKGRST